MNGDGLNVVRINKNELLTTLKKNRDEHREIFLEALDGYHKAAVKALEDRVAEAKQNKKISLAFRLIEPQDQTKQYDRVIKMLEMSVDEIVELTQSEFAMYVMDDWNWTGQFLASNSTYSAKAARKLA